jgi:hypothetical protein
LSFGEMAENHVGAVAGDESGAADRAEGAAVPGRIGALPRRTAIGAAVESQK